VDLASREPVAGLILESTFTSTFRVAFPIPILPFDRFNNLSKIHRVRCPVLLMHGTQDEVIPFAHSQTLYRQITAPKQLLTVEGAGHNNLMEVAGMQYSQALQDFIRLLNRTPLPSTQTADL
jgi:hypothetical protein